MAREEFARGHRATVGRLKPHNPDHFTVARGNVELVAGRPHDGSARLIGTSPRS